ncbi:MAG TPA: HAMP domain-containing sensor histidine kinase [Terriglobales bacterium]|nr:HAMP domain-containing sensor histidine kinase [Terriglobales bacterium]
MAASPDNTCLSRPDNAKDQADAKAYPRAGLEEPENVSPAERQQALLESYNQLRERMQRTTNALASAAHDLKTPLAVLNGYIELLRSGKLGPLNERQSGVLDDMHASGQRLQHFIQDFLNYSVLETGELRMQFEAGDLNACLSEVCRLWSQRFQDKGLALYFLANDKLPVFPFDSAKVQRVVSNLLENASKFTPAGGTVWLHAEPYMWERRTVAQPGVEPAVEEERRRQQLAAPNAIKVSVSDTGPGIPPEYHFEVFDDFFRLPSDENHSEGMGLGLAIARRLVHGMDGKIWVESEPGAGCKFSFLVPLRPAPTSYARGKNK